VRTIVIGAGLAGLSAACHLVGGGHDVVVLERDPLVGGRSNRLDLGGFRFDTGPVVMTMPELLDDALRAAGADPAELLRMKRLDPAYRAIYHDGSELEISADMAALRARIASGFGPDNAAGFDRYIAWLEELYQVEFEPFVNTNLDSALDLVRRPVLAARLLRLGGLRSLDSAVSSFFTDDRLTKIFSFQALYAGVSPADARAVLAVITYMDTVRGVFYPEGGMHAIPRAMADAAEQGGAELHTGVTVEAILRRSDGAVAGVRTSDGERIQADAVVCTLDLPVAYDRLLPDVPAPRRLRTGSYSPSAVVWHVGAKGRPGPNVRHHNIHFGREWSESFEALIGRGTLMPDPSRLVTVPSMSDPDAAPEGSTSMYVLEPVPHTGAGIDWTSEGPALRERLHTLLEEGGYPTEIEVEALVTPDDWEGMGMHLGTPFALAHTFFQSGPFRPPNHERRVPGLVFAGSGTTPGVGIPMVLISGRLAAERVADYARRMR
jgi:phytoene desaturase